MSYKSALFQIIIFCFSFLLAAQKTAVHQPYNKDYLTALSLFEIGSYASAQSLFDDLQQQSKIHKWLPMRPIILQFVPFD